MFDCCAFWVKRGKEKKVKMVDILEVTYSKLTYSTSPTRSTIFLLSAMRNVELQRLFTNKGGVEIHHPSETSLA